MKGLSDLHVQWLSNYLDETNPQHGQLIKENAAVRLRVINQ